MKMSQLSDLVISLALILGLSDLAMGLQCQRISVPTCQGLGYNMTALPNLAGHATQLDAELMITQLLPILESGCSKHARFLLCASLFPLCSPDVPRPVTACKSLCETVQRDCCTNEPILALLWPKFLSCDALPQPEKQELCMQVPQNEVKIEKSGPNTFWPWLWKMSHHAKSNPGVICPTNYTALDQECVPQCATDAMYTGKQKKVAEALILALSAVCFVLTLFSLVTFWAEPNRFGYPERPVLFLALCYNLLSICYLERIVFHNPVKEGTSLETNTCVLSPPCLASYITTSYLTLCAASWWLIFALCYYLSSNKKWSSEALEKKSGLFHVLAWVPPLGPPIGALLWGAVKPHELSGMCTAPGFVEIPAMALLLFGAIFTVLASRSLQGLQEQLRTNNESKRFSQVRKRVLVFSFVYFVPAVLAVVLSFFEELESYLPPCISAETCQIPEKSSAIPTLVKLVFHLAGGSLTGMWVWSRKTCDAYRSRIGAVPLTPNSTTKSTSTISKKGNPVAPLYSGINFHNIPAYNTHSRV